MLTGVSMTTLDEAIVGRNKAYRIYEHLRSKVRDTNKELKNWIKLIAAAADKSKNQDSHAGGCCSHAFSLHWREC